MWVQLHTIQYVEKNGKQRAHYPGDWVNVGKQEAQLWLSRGDAVVPEQNAYREFGLDGAGVLICGTAADSTEKARATLEPYKDKLSIEASHSPALLWQRTAIWNPEVILRREFLPVGIGLLDTWQIAIPLWSYTQLAIHVGSEEDREQTRAIVRDLRVPLYDTRLIFAKRSTETERLFELWKAENKKGDEKLAFLRALYQAKPFVLALPVTWTNPNER